MLASARRKWFLITIAFCTAFVVDRVLADALVVTRAMKASTVAEIFVEEDQIRVEIEVGVQDIEAFRNILPDELFEKLTGETSPLADRLRTFLEHDWVIRAGDEQLEGNIERVVPAKRVKRDEITGDPLAGQSVDAEGVIRIELRYVLDDRPPTLSFRPPRDPDTGMAAASIGFVVYHKGVAVNDFRYLSQVETLQLDWSDPWYSSFRNRNLRRRYYAPAAAFLYVENFEVRKEIVFRPKDLQNWVDLGLEGKSLIRAAERDAICQQAAAFLAQHTPVEMDGEPREGTLDRVHFIQRTLRSSGVVELGEDVDVNTALIGAIYVYPIDSLPSKVTMGWDLFSDRITRVPTVASDEAGGLPSCIEPDDPVLVWQNYLTNPSKPSFMTVPPPPRATRVPIPLAALFCLVVVCVVWIRWYRTEMANRSPWIRPVTISAVTLLVAVAVTPWTTPKVAVPGTGRQTVAEKDVTDITRGLLHNVYRAFDYRDESTVYDVLDRSISGDLLATVYVQTQQSLTLASQGGARVKVNDVELVDCEGRPTDDGDGFVATCGWNVTGSVGHWGHIHQRKNQYRAEIVVRPVADQWKIHELQLLAEQRLE